MLNKKAAETAAFFYSPAGCQAQQETHNIISITGQPFSQTLFLLISQTCVIIGRDSFQFFFYSCVYFKPRDKFMYRFFINGIFSPCEFF